MASLLTFTLNTARAFAEDKQTGGDQEEIGSGLTWVLNAVAGAN